MQYIAPKEERDIPFFEFSHWKMEDAENNVPMVCLLLMALRTYLQKVNKNQPDVSIQSTVSRRAKLLKNSGC
ncbi:MAG: hypothetical protein ACI4I4_05520 [Acutalibacteraceae bacterium]